MKKKYRITPLEWIDNSDRSEKPVHFSYQASTPFGSYEVKKTENTDGWRWGYCFDEYYDEDDFECSNLADGKKKAEENWLIRISRALQEVKND